MAHSPVLEPPPPALASPPLQEAPRRPCVAVNANPAIPVEDLPDYNKFITENDTPVDNIFSYLAQTLLALPLIDTWRGGPDGKKFLALANVGVYATDMAEVIVPDFTFRIDAEIVGDPWLKENRCYYCWRHSPPDVVVEIVSNQKGGEDTSKLALYGAMKTDWYVIFDPQKLLSEKILRFFERRGGVLRPTVALELADAGLRLGTWEGEFRGMRQTWLRWFDLRGQLIPTGMERADVEKERADAEKGRADTEKERADIEKERAERLAAKLRALGVEPD